MKAEETSAVSKWLLMLFVVSRTPSVDILRVRPQVMAAPLDPAMPARQGESEV